MPTWLRPLDAEKVGSENTSNDSIEAVEMQLENELGAHASNARMEHYDKEIRSARRLDVDRSQTEKTLAQELEAAGSGGSPISLKAPTAGSPDGAPNKRSPQVRTPNSVPHIAAEPTTTAPSLPEGPGPVSHRNTAAGSVPAAEESDERRRLREQYQAAFKQRELQATEQVRAAVAESPQKTTGDRGDGSEEGSEAGNAPNQ